MAMFFPIMIFAISGFEHCIANMAFIPLGLMYGADADYKKWLYQNLLLVILGNIIGGGIVVGGAEYFLFDWTRLLSAADDNSPPQGPHYHPHSHEEHSDGTSSHCSTHDAEPQSRHGRCHCGAACAANGSGMAAGDLDPARVREVFAAMDSDGDGALDAQELACALHALGVPAATPWPSSAPSPARARGRRGRRSGSTWRRWRSRPASSSSSRPSASPPAPRRPSPPPLAEAGLT